MHVRAGEISAFEHGEHLHKQAWLVRIAGEARKPKTSVVLPRNLVGEHDGRSRRIAARPRAVALWNLDIGCRADAGDEVGAAFLLGAVPMDLGGVIDHERSLRDPRGVGGVQHGSGAPPCGAVDHGDEPVVRVIVRIAEAAGLELVDIDVKFGLVRVAVKDGLIGRDLVGRIAPLELVGRHIGDGRRIEFDGAACRDKAQSCGRDRKCDRKRKMRQSATIGHFSSYMPMLLRSAWPR